MPSCPLQSSVWLREIKSLSDLSLSPLETPLNDSHPDSIGIIV